MTSGPARKRAGDHVLVGGIRREGHDSRPPTQFPSRCRPRWWFPQRQRGIVNEVARASALRVRANATGVAHDEALQHSHLALTKHCAGIARLVHLNSSGACLRAWRGPPS